MSRIDLAAAALSTLIRELCVPIKTKGSTFDSDLYNSCSYSVYITQCDFDTIRKCLVERGFQQSESGSLIKENQIGTVVVSYAEEIGRMSITVIV